MKAVVLSIGTELTRGELVNTNATWLSEQLVELGLEVTEHWTLPDDGPAIVAGLRRVASVCDVVICTGGLGPTSDDLTAASVAESLGVSLATDRATLEAIRRRYEARGRTMTEAGARMAELPEGATVLPNPVGAAPGFAVTLGECELCFLPGVPHEMQAIFRESIVARVAPRVRRTTHQVHLRTFGLPESEVAARLKELEESNDDLVVGYRASFPEVEVKVLARAIDGSSAEARARELARQVRERLGDFVFGEREDSFARAVGEALRGRGWKLALAESCTGGLVGQLVTAVAGSSDYLLLGAVTYSNAAKTSMLGVSPEILRAHGAVSAECAIAMAEGARRLAGSDVAVSITGIAGPGGGSDDKPVGTVWLALALHGETWVTRHHFVGDRDAIRAHAAHVALDLVRRAALRLDPVDTWTSKEIERLERN
ncbi:MAG: competence/damage-inducible protein A [Sandaracinus sp.]|nr:competence/damage-inducible protein A [Sandaracinus sp.]